MCQNFKIKVNDKIRKEGRRKTMKEQIEQFLEEKNYSKLHELLVTQNSADIAILLEELDKEALAVVYRLLPKDIAVDTFAYIEPEGQERLIHALTDKEIKEVMDNLFLDDTVDLIEEMPANVVKRLLKNTDATQRRLINEYLKYPEDSAGSIMTNEFVDLKKNMTVAEAFKRIKKIGVEKETIYTCYVLNASRRLEGLVTVKTLLLSDEHEKIENIMHKNLITVNTLEDQEEIAKKFNKYDFLALPVVDTENRLVGIITFDDAMSVLQEENTEDFEIMAAMTPAEDGYFKTTVLQHAKNRIVWLLILMLSATLTGAIITNYENAFATIPVLVAFIPMIMGTGGNCSSQSATLIIRGLATDDIQLKDFLKVVWKEVRVALLVGVTLAVANGIRILIQYKELKLSVAVGLTLIGTVTLSKLLGCMLPMLAKKLKLDPAIMAAPLLSTVLDTCSVLIYFNVAMLILGH